MAVNLDEAIRQIQALRTNIGNDLKLALEEAALNGFTLMEQRFINTGRDATGAEFKPYSKNPLPWITYEDVPAVKKVSPAQKKKYPGGISYADWKKLIGRDVGHRNFRLTGEMLNGIGLIEKKNATGGYMVVIGGRKPEVVKKMLNNQKITPGWFTLSKAEISKTEELFIIRTDKAISKYIK